MSEHNELSVPGMAAKITIAPSDRPNVVVILADDLGYGDISCFGATDFETPNIDRLAVLGATFTDYYANAPVCSPSRASLLTGKYPGRAGVDEILGGHSGTKGLPPQDTIASILNASGYATGIFGKWHLGTGPGHTPQDHGFKEQYGFLAGCIDYYSHIYYWAPDRNALHDLWRNGRHVYENGRYMTEAIAEEATAFIRSHAEERFFCYVPFNAPHYPMHAPAKYVQRFPQLGDERRIMAAMISALDDAVGAIIDELEQHDLLENTIIVFSSDNGPSAESRNWLDGEEVAYAGGSTGGFRANKGSLYEGGIRVPTLISWPKQIPAGSVVRTPSALMDILPTVLDAASIPVEKRNVHQSVDGVDLLPFINRVNVDDVTRVLFFAYEGQSAARHGKWKLVRNPVEHLGGEPLLGTFLFDLESDPAETVDVAAENPQVLLRLTSVLDDWLEDQYAVAI